jgi:hypothetical protein
MTYKAVGWVVYSDIHKCHYMDCCGYDKAAAISKYETQYQCRYEDRQRVTKLKCVRLYVEVSNDQERV